KSVIATGMSRSMIHEPCSFVETVNFCHPEALLLREGSRALLRTQLRPSGSSARHSIQHGLRASLVHFEPKHTGRSFVQKKRFTITNA
ncbi:MAG TPA: hypothetical protein VM912_00125, partial [Terriglobales bacterium]|nr:hypothetical protein [Terriglobales bacterium]